MPPATVVRTSSDFRSSALLRARLKARFLCALQWAAVFLPIPEIFVTEVTPEPVVAIGPTLGSPLRSVRRSNIFLVERDAFQLSFQGRAISNPTRAFFRRLLRTEAVAKWKLRTVQGKLASVSGVFSPGLTFGCSHASKSPLSGTAGCSPQTHTRSTSLPSLTAVCVLSVEAGLSGCIPTRLLDLAHRWSEADGISHRTCPLCRALPGTPRHVVMSCRLCSL